MTFEEAYLRILESLTPRLGEREAGHVAKYYLEDVWDMKSTSSKQLVTKAQKEKFETDLKELKEGQPLQYVTGKAWFYDMEFNVTPDVLIPRPETEELVDLVIKHFKAHVGSVSFLEIGTGSACIAVTLAKNLPQAKIKAMDISAQAIACARINANKLSVSVDFEVNDWLLSWQEYLKHDFDCIVSNPPYIDRDEIDVMGSSVLKHEPHLALFAEEKGLIFYRTIADYVARKERKPILFLELNEFKAKEIQSMFTEYYKSVNIIKDLQGKQRILCAHNN